MSFRGPCRVLDQPYIAALGGTETYGKFVPHPYPALVEGALGLPIVNLGAVNAGLDLYLNEPGLMQMMVRAEAVVVQVVGAQNLSNRFYHVHRRRNDRFLGATAQLRALYPEVDFTEFSFTRHLLFTLQKVSPDRFEHVAAELRAVWVAQMTQLLRLVPERGVLLWFADHAPPAVGGAGLGQDPILVDAGMIGQLRPLLRGYVEAVSSPGAQVHRLAGMSYTPLEEPAARGMPGPLAHHEAAGLLSLALQEILA